MRFVIEATILEAFPEVQVLGFENGRLALAAFEQVGADFVVCDHFMPVMSGTALVRNLRRLQPTLPILMVSGSPEARALGAAVGVSAFLDKDRVAPDLIHQIRVLLASSIGCHSSQPNYAAAA